MDFILTKLQASSFKACLSPHISEVGLFNHTGLKEFKTTGNRALTTLRDILSLQYADINGLPVSS